MAELQIRPSTTLIKAQYALSILLAVPFLYMYSQKRQMYWLAGLLIAFLLLVRALSKHMKTRFIQLSIVGDRLNYEAGLASKTSRSIPLTKVQDITVSQTMVQRMLGMGDVSIVTAGDNGRVTVHEVDSPRVVAERILDRVAAANPNIMKGQSPQQ